MSVSGFKLAKLREQMRQNALKETNSIEVQEVNPEPVSKKKKTDAEKLKNKKD